VFCYSSFEAVVSVYCDIAKGSSHILREEQVLLLLLNMFLGQESFGEVTVVQGGAEKRENLKLTMRFRPAVKFLLHVGS
jgi:hypothetical protein